MADERQRHLQLYNFVFVFLPGRPKLRDGDLKFLGSLPVGDAAQAQSFVGVECSVCMVTGLLAALSTLRRRPRRRRRRRRAIRRPLSVCFPLNGFGLFSPKLHCLQRARDIFVARRLLSTGSEERS